MFGVPGLTYSNALSIDIISGMMFARRHLPATIASRYTLHDIPGHIRSSTQVLKSCVLACAKYHPAVPSM